MSDNTLLYILLVAIILFIVFHFFVVVYNSNCAPSPNLRLQHTADPVVNFEQHPMKLLQDAAKDQLHRWPARDFVKLWDSVVGSIVIRADPAQPGDDAIRDIEALALPAPPRPARLSVGRPSGMNLGLVAVPYS